MKSIKSLIEIKHYQRAMELGLRLLMCINKLLSFLFTPILIFIFGNKKQNRLPKITNPILEICAVDLAEKIRNREVRYYSI